MLNRLLNNTLQAERQLASTLHGKREEYKTIIQILIDNNCIISEGTDYLYITKSFVELRRNFKRSDFVLDIERGVVTLNVRTPKDEVRAIQDRFHKLGVN